MMDSVKNFLRIRRQQLGLTLEEVGTAVGVTKSTVRKWETGTIANMRRDKIQKLSEILQISPTIFTGLSGPQENIGHFLKEEREAQGISVSEISRCFNLSEQEYNNFEDETEPIDGLLAEAIAFYLGHNMEELYLLSNDFDEEIPREFNGDIIAYSNFCKALDLDRSVDSPNLVNIDKKTQSLLEKFDLLNDEGQQEAIKQVDNLTYNPKYSKISEFKAKEIKEDPYTVIAAHNDNEDPDQYDLMMQDAADLLEDD